MKTSKSEFIQGSCYCRSVRFEIRLPTDFCSHCHCQSCRRLHGSAFVTWTGVPRTQFKFLEGQNLIRQYESSPGVKWGFCDKCGTSLLNEHHAAPEKIYMTVANLESELDRLPEGHVSYEEHVTWLHIGDNVPKFRGKTSEIIK